MVLPIEFIGDTNLCVSIKYIQKLMWFWAEQVGNIRVLNIQSVPMKNISLLDCGDNDNASAFFDKRSFCLMTTATRNSCRLGLWKFVEFVACADIQCISAFPLAN